MVTLEASICQAEAVLYRSCHFAFAVTPAWVCLSPNLWAGDHNGPCEGFSHPPAWSRNRPRTGRALLPLGGHTHLLKGNPFGFLGACH
jgi:hypothetical protein